MWADTYGPALTELTLLYHAPELSGSSEVITLARPLMLRGTLCATPYIHRFRTSGRHCQSMGTALTGLIAFMLVIGAAVTAVNVVLSTGGNRAEATTADNERLIEELETSISLVSATTLEGSGNQFDVVVTNDGRRSLGSFDDWDITMGAAGETFTSPVYSDTLLDNTWITQSFWLDYAGSQPELIEAGRLNTHEEVVLRIQLDPSIAPNGPLVITVTAPTGHTDTIIVYRPLALDNKTTDEADTSSFSFPHTVTSSGSQLLLIVGVMTDSGATVSVTPTYAGQDMSPVISRTHASGKPRVEIWELVAPATGSNTVAVSLSSSDKAAVSAISFTGAYQTTPTEASLCAEGTSSSASVPIASATDDLVLDVMASQAPGSPTVDPSQSQQWNVELGGGGTSNHFGGGSTEAGAAPVSMDWSLGERKEWVVCGLNIND